MVKSIFCSLLKRSSSYLDFHFSYSFSSNLGNYHEVCQIAKQCLCLFIWLIMLFWIISFSTPLSYFWMILLVDVCIFWSLMKIFLFYLYILKAMGRAATSLSKLADTAREELPSTMAAIRLSGMEISDLTLELSDLRWQ